MRVAHNHRPNGMGARNENGFLVCAQCGQACHDPKPEPEASPLPVIPPLIRRAEVTSRKVDDEHS